MAVYDQFLKNEQPDFADKLLTENAVRLLGYVFEKYQFDKETAKILEIGPGKGFLHKAVTEGEYGDYYAMDRNENMLRNLAIDSRKCIIGALPHVETEEKFDIIFVGFVIEHLESGLQLNESLMELKKKLTNNGIIILQFPDCMKLGVEFYNIDYTHIFPTTKRNVNQAVIDCGMTVLEAIDISGILYTKKVNSKVRYYMRRLLLCLYSYRLCSIVFIPFYRVPLWDMKNVFWRFYALLKEPNVMFIIK